MNQYNIQIKSNQKNGSQKSKFLISPFVDISESFAIFSSTYEYQCYVSNIVYKITIMHNIVSAFSDYLIITPIG